MTFSRVKRAKAGPPEMAAIPVRQLSPHWINIKPWVQQPQVIKRKLDAE